MQNLTPNQIESTVTIITKQRDGLLKFAESDGRARDAATILSTAITVLQSDFYSTEPETPVVDEAEEEGDPSDNDPITGVFADPPSDPVNTGGGDSD